MFRPITKETSQPAAKLEEAVHETIEFAFDGQRLRGRSGDSVAASLLANGIVAFRETPVSASKRGPYCMMGVCFECLVVVDGVGNRQACLTPLREGMVVETQHGPRSVDTLEDSAQ